MSFEMRPLGQGEDVSLYLRDAFDRFERYITQRLERVPLFTAAPVNPEEGDIVRADGTSWDPGSGGGFYGYHAGAWVFLG